MLTEEMKKKIEFVKKLDEAIKVAGKNVEQVTYKIFESDLELKEYLVVTYKGGARAARNCTGDSCYAIVEELGSLLYGGYYDEVGHLERYECNPKYKLISEISVEPAEPERKWIPCSTPPKHHRDVLVRGIEAIGNVTVHKVMQWDVDRWRPTDYAPSIFWKEWSEI